MNPTICFRILTIALFVTLSARAFSQSDFQVQRLDEIKISDLGMYFDGSQVTGGARNSYVDAPGSQYDYAFGSRITPHGDCIKVHGDYVFLTWYRGPETDRHVMLTRYNRQTGSQKTIEFPHRHTGFQNNPNLGESHNTIAVGICEIDQTVHLLYDMHAYSPSRPSDGSLANDYFRYQYSLPGTATLPDDEFTLDKFMPKQLYLRAGEDYTELTYPNFFTNSDGELLVVMRQGGHNNGKFQFASYDGEQWSTWRDFNTMGAGNKGYAYNWGLYGDMKVFDGKFHIGFATRYANNNDRYVYNNGIHYAYSTDPRGLSNWFTANDEAISIPLINPDLIKVSEPGDVFDTQDANSIRINTSVNWTKTRNGSLHFVSRVKNDQTGEIKDVHTYRGPDETAFTVSTDFPGGSLYPLGDSVYLIELVGGRPRIHRAPEGTNDWETVYSTNSGRTFRHGNVRISDNQLFFYLMEEKSGSAQPIYLQIYQLEEPLPEPKLSIELNPSEQNIRLRWPTLSGHSYQLLEKAE